MGPTTVGNLAGLAAGDSWVELWQTNFLIILDSTLVILFLIETCRRIRGVNGWQFGGLLHDPPTKIIWALGLNYLARITDRLWLLMRHYRSTDEMVHATLAVAALLLAIWSAGCILRVFSGVVWGKRAWLWIVGLAGIGATLAMSVADLTPF